MFSRCTDEITDEVVGRCQSMKAAIKLCVEVSGLCVKEIAFQLDREEKWVSRVLADNPDDNRHFPPDLLGKLMDVCGNEIPLRWLALSRGYGLHKLKSRLEEENETLQRQLEEEQRKMETIMEFMKQIKGAA